MQDATPTIIYGCGFARPRSTQDHGYDVAMYERRSGRRDRPSECMLVCTSRRESYSTERQDKVGCSFGFSHANKLHHPLGDRTFLAQQSPQRFALVCFLAMSINLQYFVISTSHGRGYPFDPQWRRQRQHRPPERARGPRKQNRLQHPILPFVARPERRWTQ